MDNKKFVQFEVYCEKCKNKDKSATADPCNECLAIPARENSHKPEFFEEV